MKKIGILTGGGDCPGLNAVIRGVVERCAKAGVECIGLKYGWKGAVECDPKPLTLDDVDGIQTKGGTILGSSRTNVMKVENGPEKVRATMNKLGLDAIVAIGGDDTLGVAGKLTAMGMNMVGVPKTIDNDLSSTDYTFGFDTSSNIVMEAIDRLHTTAEAHARTMVVEIMGRHTGWIAIQGGLAGNAHMVLIPEFPVHIDEITDLVKNRRANGKPYSVIAVAEGFWPEGLSLEVGEEKKDAFGNVVLPDRSVGKTLADVIEKRTGAETRYVVLGHLQRGGAPSAFDRILGTRMGIKAAELVLEGKFGFMVALKGTEIAAVNIADAVSTRKKVDKTFYDCARLYER
jgi:ATP-dependent phosphofructokinase / diphosphate-dependent phosphofructokinase